MSNKKPGFVLIHKKFIVYASEMAIYKHDDIPGYVSIGNYKYVSDNCQISILDNLYKLTGTFFKISQEEGKPDRQEIVIIKDKQINPNDWQDEILMCKNMKEVIENIIELRLISVLEAFIKAGLIDNVTIDNLASHYLHKELKAQRDEMLAHVVDKDYQPGESINFTFEQPSEEPVKPNNKKRI